MKHTAHSGPRVTNCTSLLRAGSPEEGREESRGSFELGPASSSPTSPTAQAGTAGKAPMFLLQPQETYYPCSHSVPSVPFSSSRLGGSEEGGRGLQAATAAQVTSGEVASII